jgi:hypothetical protein
MRGGGGLNPKPRLWYQVGSPPLPVQLYHLGDMEGVGCLLYYDPTDMN